MKKLLFIFGTRPEAIKMAPLILNFSKFPAEYKVEICNTAQHRQMVDQVLAFFDIKPDFDLNLMKQNQTLFDITSAGLQKLEEVIDQSCPDLIFVQGDTTTAMIGALAGYYKKIQVAHIEAGLRSGEKYSPYPEEVNRQLISKIADFHFAPTSNAVLNLNVEGILKNVWNVGNTVIDALFLGLEIIKKCDYISPDFSYLAKDKKTILVTGHRRESFGEPFENICKALTSLAEEFKNEIQVVYPVHLNPNVREPVNRYLKGIDNVHLIEPLEYPSLIWLMSKSYLVLTDSGGIQEEAPSLGIPVLVMRDVSERMEGVHAGTAKIVGTSQNSITKEIRHLIVNSNEYKKMASAVNPYGSGDTSKQVYEILKNVYI